MDLVPKVLPDGTAKFFARCTEHNYWYKGRPPLTTGCPDCWRVFFFMQAAQSGDARLAVDQLEPAIRHAAEQIEAGTWDFEPLARPEISITSEDSN